MTRPPGKRARCRMSGKIRYATKRQAVKFAERGGVVNVYRLPSPLLRTKGSAYRCPHCGFWHITTQEPRT